MGKKQLTLNIGFTLVYITFNETMVHFTACYSWFQHVQLVTACLPGPPSMFGAEALQVMVRR